MNRAEIVNRLLTRAGQPGQTRKYLEIGLFDGWCFPQINAGYKISVDPEKNSEYLTHEMTSDEFFEQNTDKFDVIFIDGLHHSDQVYKDIMNSLNVLTPKGFIVCHDINPPNEERQIIPMKEWPWNGDCWKAWVKIRNEERNLKMFVVDTDEGVGVITRGQQELLRIKLSDKIGYGLKYKDLEENRNHYLNLIRVNDFERAY